jgi:hypothetical protein
MPAKRLSALIRAKTALNFLLDTLKMGMQLSFLFLGHGDFVCVPLPPASHRTGFLHPSAIAFLTLFTRTTGDFCKITYLTAQVELGG